LIGLVAFLLLAQLVPIDRSNPPVTAEVPAPPAVRAILERSCYDCHSNQSRWPWYGYVAPLSWVMAYDIHEARDHVNFSTWDAYTEKKRVDMLEEVWEQVDEGEMPFFVYLPLHPEAELSEADKQLLEDWADPAL
jgi:hypothetical protein